MLTFICQLLFCSLLPNQNLANPIVNTTLGQIKGFWQNSDKGKTFSAFEGIPFAKPPIGPNRFEIAEAIKPWNGIWNANFLTKCAQNNFMENRLEGSEDCLYLNVYVPNENPSNAQNFDVIVHIHGGSFLVGSGHDYCTPFYLMDQNVIFVSFNYRLNIFGFLTTEDDLIAGNMGLKDQVIALQWVNDHIKSFGGNPNSVTLTGFSAGAGSVHLHYFSKMSRGLFQRGFAQSGSAMQYWAVQKNVLKNVEIVAEEVGCPVRSKALMVECLKERPMELLLDKISLVFHLSGMPLVPFAPVVEKGANPFLDDLPYILLKKGLVLDVPIIFSHTSHEAEFPIFNITNNLEVLDKNWSQFLPVLLSFQNSVPHAKWAEISDKIRSYYVPNNEKLGNTNLEQVTQMLSDRCFYVDTETAIVEQSKVNKSPVYYYMFSYTDNQDKKYIGHGDDIPFLYGKNLFGFSNFTENELKMKDVMLEILVSFAKNGTPSFLTSTKGDMITYVDLKGYQAMDFKTMSKTDQTTRDFWKSLGFQENENLIVQREEL